MIRTMVALASAALFTLPAAASVITLDFEGAGNQAALLNFYNGGTDSAGNSGANYGVSFGGNALSLVDADAGGSGNFANEPSPSTIMFFLSGTTDLNYAPGFTSGFSFYYSSSTDADVNVYSGENASGTLLGTIHLNAQAFNGCSGDPTGQFCNWSAAGVAFAGIAKSIDFGGTVNQTGYDNITFGSSVPTIPEPSTYALMALGLAGVGAIARRRKST
jgi:hypothetical protein